jgi:hypothetical protein
MIPQQTAQTPHAFAHVDADSPDDDAGGEGIDNASDAHLDELCERLAWWIHTRRFYGGPRGPVSLLGKLRTATRPLKPGGGPDPACAPELAALYIALRAQPSNDLGRVVFELHYLTRVKVVKAAAAELGIGRQHWYTLLRGFRRRLYAASREILAANQAALRELRRE